MQRLVPKELKFKNEFIRLNSLILSARIIYKKSAISWSWKNSHVILLKLKYDFPRDIDIIILSDLDWLLKFNLGSDCVLRFHNIHVPKLLWRSFSSQNLSIIVSFKNLCDISRKIRRSRQNYKNPAKVACFSSVSFRFVYNCEIFAQNLKIFWIVGF